MLPGKTEEFKAALQSLSALARKQPGYRGFLLLGPAGDDTPDTTIIAIWDSFDAMRDSERNLFLTQALAHLFQFCDGLPHILERPVLASNFPGAAT
jgi:antibiotic biosynthesis monooxygenase (ABM) superfamily enzyme